MPRFSRQGLAVSRAVSGTASGTASGIASGTAAAVTARAADVAVGLVVVLLGGSVHAAPPSALQGMVTAVRSGDTVLLTLADQKVLTVRLRDIDAPESCQPWGAESRAALSTLALNKVATLQVSGRDGQGRSVGNLSIDDLNVSRFLVENGHAWSVRTRWDQGPLVKQEKVARALTRGLHTLPGAVLPKEFRRLHGACENMPAAASAPAAAAAPPAKKK